MWTYQNFIIKINKGLQVTLFCGSGIVLENAGKYTLCQNKTFTQYHFLIVAVNPRTKIIKTRTKVSSLIGYSFVLCEEISTAHRW